ncbi:MAG TPA: hypothetical protein VEB66_01665 [Opitutaceae bacterium]|nr:hypothetical protein [Opitutaceae bacterium]
MEPPEKSREPLTIRDPEAGESPDVPGFRTWRGVYLFVFVVFVLVVVGLTVFREVFA